MYVHVTCAKAQSGAHNDEESDIVLVHANFRRIRYNVVEKAALRCHT